MLSTPLICCSMGVATDASTSVAEAPTKVVVTWIWGGTISGYWAIGSRLKATIPKIIMTIEITIATMGRLTKKRANMIRIPWAYCAGFGVSVADGAISALIDTV